MKSTTFRTQALSILAVRHGRELTEALSQLPASAFEDLTKASLSGLLRRLEAGDVANGRDLVTLETLQRNLAGQMAFHIQDVKEEPRVVGHDEQGEIWAYVDVPVYSECGEKLCNAHAELKRFLEVRQQLLDHANAEKLASRLLR